MTSSLTVDKMADVTQATTEHVLSFRLVSKMTFTKLMGAVFWNKHGTVHIDKLQLEY